MAADPGLLAHAGQHYEPLAFGAYDILLVILIISVVFAAVRAAARARARRAHLSDS